MLTDQQIKWIAAEVNKKVDIPIIGEEFEQMIIEAGIKKIDQLLDKELPPQFREFINDVTKGIEPGSPTDLQVLKDNLIVYINDHVNIPLIGKRAERKLIAEVIEIIVEALQKGKSL
jgi:hypothetical protein